MMESSGASTVLDAPPSVAATQSDRTGAPVPRAPAPKRPVDARGGRLVGWWDAVSRYLLAVVMVAAVALFRAAVLQPWLGPQVPLVLFILPVIVAAWIGGLGPGLFATGLATLVGTLFMVTREPDPGVGPALVAVRVGSFVIEGVVVSVICHLLQRVVRRLGAHEQLLQASNDHLEAMFELSSVGQARVDPRTGRFLRVNRRLCEIFGYEERELIGLRPPDLTHPDDRERDEAGLRRFLAGQTQTHSIQKRCIRKDGRVAWLDVSAAMVRDANGAPTVIVSAVQDITDRHDAEQRLDAILESVDDHLASYDRQWRYTYVNEKGARSLGKTREELLGQCIWDVFPDGRGSQYERELREALEQQTIIRSEHFYAPLEKWFENHIYPAPDGVTVFSSDITWRKQAEQAMRESEERFRLMADSAPVMIWIANSENHGTWFNNRWLEFVGKPLDEQLGLKWADCVHPADLQQAVEYCQRHFQARQPFTMEFRLRRHDGEYRWVLDTGVPRFGAGGAFQGYIGSCIDITDRKRVEEALRASEERLNVAMSAGRMGAWDWDMRSGRVQWSELLERLHGMEPGTFGGTFEDVRREMHPDDVERVMATVSKALETRHDYHVQYRIIRPDGKLAWVEAHGRILLDEQGEPWRMIGVCTDITARREAEDALRESEERFRLMVTNSPDLILYHDLNLKYQWMSNPIGPPESYVGRDEFDMLDREQAERVRAIKHRVLRTGTGERYETTMVPPNDTELHFYETALEPRRDKDGSIIGLVSYVRDITDRRRAERQIQESRRMFMRIAETTPDVLFIHDVQSDRMVYVNREVVEVLGYTPDEIQAMGPELRMLVHPEEKADAERDRRGVHNRGAEVQEREHRVRHKDGSYRWFRIRTVVFTRHDDGTPREILGLATDITEQKAYENRLREQREALETLNQVGLTLAAELDLEKLLQTVTDAGTQLTGAAFGAFFHNCVDAEGESYVLYTLSGAPREAFERFPMPRNTAVFGPTFRGEGIVRSDDISQDLRYGKNAPHRGIPEGHLPVRSYLAVPVVSRFGEVFGGLFFGHPEVAVFTERAERIAAGIAAQAAIAIDNARLYQRTQAELAERKRAEEALRQSEERLRSALDASEIGTWRVDLRANTDTRDASLNRLLGLPVEPSTVDNTDFLSRIHPDDRHIAADAWIQALRTGVFEAEHRIIRADGAVRWVRDRGRVVYGDDGEPLFMTGAVADITEGRRIAAELHESAEMNRRILQSTRDCVKVLDLEGHLLSITPAGCEAMEIDDPESVVNRLWLEFWKGDDRAAAEAAVAAACAGDVGHFVGFCPTQKGTAKWWDVVVTPILGADGQPERLLSVSRDVTAQRIAARELEKAKEDAEAASRAKDEFLAALSHELRTPLTPVLMTAQVLEQEPGLPQSLREDLAMVRRNVELEARLIDDLLDLTRITRGKLQLQHESVNVHEVLHHAQETCCDELFERKRLNLTMDLSAANPWIWGDPARLAQVFWNLIKNAIKFTPDGGSIRIATRQENGHVTIEVSDTGVGIDPELLPHIFNAFEQGGPDVTRRFGGLGLGLAISRALVDLHGGTLTANSAGRETGATFTVSVPTTEPPRIALPVEAAPISDGQSDGHPAVTRILLVEDHESTGRVLSRLLNMAGYDVHWVGRVAHALDAARTQQFDLVISDLGLPDGHGHELMRQLRDVHGLKGIALSGYGMERDVERSREAGFIEHLVKPVNFTKLKSVISECGIT